jgi:hypothetical protein
MWLNVKELEISPRLRVSVAVSGGCFGGGVVRLIIGRQDDGGRWVTESVELPDEMIDALVQGLIAAQGEARRIEPP